MGVLLVDTWISRSYPAYWYFETSFVKQLKCLTNFTIYNCQIYSIKNKLNVISKLSNNSYQSYIPFD